MKETFLLLQIWYYDDRNEEAWQTMYRELVNSEEDEQKAEKYFDSIINENIFKVNKYRIVKMESTVKKEVDV
jgi:hypothetical protein